MRIMSAPLKAQFEAALTCSAGRFTMPELWPLAVSAPSRAMAASSLAFTAPSRLRTALCMLG